MGLEEKEPLPQPAPQPPPPPPPEPEPLQATPTVNDVRCMGAFCLFEANSVQPCLLQKVVVTVPNVVYQSSNRSGNWMPCGNDDCSGICITCANTTVEQCANVCNESNLLTVCNFIEFQQADAGAMACTIKVHCQLTPPPPPPSSS